MKKKIVILASNISSINIFLKKLILSFNYELIDIHIISDSIPDKDKLGNTNVGDVASGAGNTGYYQGTVNRSTTSETVGDIVKALIETRRLYLAGQSNQEPSFVPSYV